MPGSDQIRFGPGPLKGLRVLVAEDDAWVAEQLSLILEEEGARLIGPCRSVSEARALLNTHDVQFVLVDLGLADNFADALIADAAARQIPFAIVTGYAALPTNAFDGAEEILPKPIQRRRLIEVLSRFA